MVDECCTLIVIAAAVGVSRSLAHTRNHAAWLGFIVLFCSRSDVRHFKKVASIFSKSHVLARVAR